ncbi:triose-phosphate isomerase [Sinomicrobium kalidii]|uniref:triose-phosphate isomerase n=1 Tax=Sinomicrobium kalidii TaxID=2900738 RepID=UPI001E3CFC1F|nr:triose-phosphate isomerase [Sinomicrobium kalidii]UGU15514.1 triose-phosphate isomerase [Sinomicrobium kalidii]
MRKKIVAGNWKMNNDLGQTEALLSKLLKKMPETETEVMVAPAFTNLRMAFDTLIQSPVEVIAQNMHFAENGAYTGEISADMLKSVGIQTVILGHSERRAYFNETDETLAKKVDTALEHDMTVMFCFGEELEDRKGDNHFKVVESQLEKALFHLKAAAWKNIILAYEPVWAIGTGETATPEQAQEMHKFIRKTVAEKYSDKVADGVSILYGGSVKPQNAKEIFSQPDVDGGLIGGASLKAKDFVAIVEAI